MKTYRVSSTQDLALDALLADFLAEALFKRGKTVIAFVDEGGAAIKTNSPGEVIASSLAEAYAAFEGFMQEQFGAEPVTVALSKRPIVFPARWVFFISISMSGFIFPTSQRLPITCFAADD